GLRVVEIFHARYRRDKLNAVLDARESPHAFRNRPGLDSQQRRGCGGSKNVFNIMISAQTDVSVAKENFFRAIAPEDDFIGAEKAPAGNPLFAAEPEYRRTRRCVMRRCRIV